MKFIAISNENIRMEFMTLHSDIKKDKEVIGKDGHIYLVYDIDDDVPENENKKNLPVFVNKKFRKKVQRKYHQDEFILCSINREIWKLSNSFSMYKNVYSELPVDEKILKKSVESSFMWETKVKNIRKNEFNEYIVDCIIVYPDHKDNVAITKPYPHECQYMVDVDINWSTGQTHCIYKSKNDRREPTFIESLGFFDKNAPRSPYIDSTVTKETAQCCF